MNTHEIFAKNLASSTYSDEDELKEILSKLNSADIEILSFACYRAAEKCGLAVFECNMLVDEEY